MCIKWLNGIHKKSIIHCDFTLTDNTIKITILNIVLKKRNKYGIFKKRKIRQRERDIFLTFTKPNDKYTKCFRKKIHSIN